MSKLISLSYALAFALFGFSLSFAASELQDHDDIYSAVRIFAGDSQIQNIDPRLRLGKCSRPLAVRYPFSVESTVEVRCPTDEGWKIFLTLSPKAIATQLADSENDNNTTELKLGVVTTRRLQRGIAIRPGDLELQSFPSVQLKNAHFSDPREALGMEPNQTIPKGTLIANNMLRPPMLVRKGDSVTIIFERNGLSVSNEGNALENGGLREKIKVELPDSKKVITATVQAAGIVKIP